MPAFTPDDLGLGSEELRQLVDACANKGLSNPVSDAIGLAVGQVDLYTAGYTLTVGHYQRLCRALAIAELYRLANEGNVPEGHEKAAAAALKELQEIRDGKFAGLAKVGEAPGSVSAGGAGWGSETKISLRS